MSNPSSDYRTFLLYVVGSFTLILGITLILLWWPDVITFLKGVIGLGLALSGLFVLYSLKK
ncbi:MAG: hypothetical protein Q7S13_01285 [Candidatus Omnitrophota bacterium]|nr:hypothetical protein [Candidatus Omnitrophota bacterium]